MITSSRQIRIHEDTIKILDDCKLIPTESYDSVIKRLLAEIDQG